MIVQTNKGRFKISTVEDEQGLSVLAVATNVDDNRHFYTFSINSIIEDIVKQINEMED